MKNRMTLLLLGLMISISVFAQMADSATSILEMSNIQLDSTDRVWLNENSSFLVDMTSLAKADTTAMNRAIIQMSTKLLSNNLIIL